MRSPGLTKEELEDLLVTCDTCRLITTHLVFCMHECSVEDSEAELTEALTDSDDDNEEEV